MIAVLQTPRPTLRGPRLDDCEPVAIFLDSDRAAYIGGRRNRTDAWRTFAVLVGHRELRGYGMASVEDRATGASVGMVGLYYPEDWYPEDWCPEDWCPEDWLAPEVGWWIGDPACEGKGYARETAVAARRYAFDIAGRPEVFSVIAPENARSIRLAERLGATFDRTVAAPNGRPAPIFRHPAPEARA